MHRMVRPIVEFLRWLLASERLPPRDDAVETHSRREQPFAGWVVARDDLPSRPAVPRGRRGVTGWVLSGEPLADSPAPRRAAPPETPVKWVLRAETCPDRPPPSSLRRQSFVAWLLSPSPWPDVPAPADRRRHGFLSWLMARERL